MFRKILQLNMEPPGLKGPGHILRGKDARALNARASRVQPLGLSTLRFALHRFPFAKYRLQLLIQ
ncbi:hypothetical protein D3C75_793750 [compost metagenome]